MFFLCKRAWRVCRGRVADFGRDTSGQILIIFALSSVAIFAGLGAGVDLATAYSARQKLSEVATLACQYSTRPSVAQTASANYSGNNGFQTYVAAVNAFAASSLTTQHWANATPTGASGTAGQYFTATPAAGGTTAASNAPTNPTVTLQANVPTNFGRILNVTSIPVKTTIACQTAAVAPPIVNGSPILSESFETPCASYCYTPPVAGGVVGLFPTQSAPPYPSYTGSTGYQWYLIGYCLETDITGIINSTSPEGTHTAELDCGNAPTNGYSTAGNSSISSKVYLAAGYYELRYNYRSRVDYPDYDPAYICGSTASDLAWANDLSGFNLAEPGLSLRTNQINVYLDRASSSTSIPLHTTLDYLQQLGGSNLIDMCVYAQTWVERSIKIHVTAPGYYWLSFAADGRSDSYGGQIDNIRFCQETCAGTPQDNFPPLWVAANNGGVNKVLFEDTFESPTYVQDPFTSSAHAKAGNLALSTGVTIVTASCNGLYYPSPPGWPCQPASGWSTAPYNQVVYWMQGATQGSQYISLQGWNGLTSLIDPINRAISRPFLLDPGYYKISYNYTSMMDFSYDFIYGTNCTSVPTVANNYSLYGMKHGYDYGSNNSPLYSQYQSTNFVNLYLSNGQLISTPILSTVVGAPATYTNPDGSISLTPTVPADSGSIFAAYNAAAVNPVLDTCSYSGGHTWTARSVNVKITKPGLYWITFSTQGDPLTGTGAGAAIDDVKLTALGSPYMSSPPTSPLVPIPVPAPQPDTSFTNGSNPGYTIVADPFVPPGADL